MRTESIGTSRLRLIVDLLRYIRRSAKFGRTVKFCIVGGSSIGIYGGILYLLTSKLGLLYIISAIFSWTITILYMFTLHELWTFRDRRKRGASAILKRVLKFGAVRLIGMAINLLILTGLTELLGTYYLLAALLAIAVVMVWNFIASSSLVWRKDSRT